MANLLGAGPAPGNAAGIDTYARETYADDFAYCRSYDGLNIMITGSTGNIGSYLVDALLKNSRPNKVGLFCRDD